MLKQGLSDGGSDRALGATPDPVPGLDRPFEVDFQVLSDRLADVPDEANGLLKLLDGRRTLREALAQAQDAAQAAAAARDLAALGVIRPGVSGSDPPTSRDGEAGGPLAERANAPKALPPWAEPPLSRDGGAGANAPVASASGKGASIPPRIVRFPARRKRLPPPPSRLAGGASGGPRASSSANGARRFGSNAVDALRSSDAPGSLRVRSAGPDLPEQRGASRGEDPTPGWRRRAAVILIAGALAAGMASALIFLHRKGAGAEPPPDAVAPGEESAPGVPGSPSPP